MSFANKWIMAVFLGAFSITCLAGVRPGIGSTAHIHPGEPIPDSPEGLMWMVQQHIQNMTMTIPGLPPPPQGPILEVVLTQIDREHAGDRFKSTEIGGILPRSDSFFQWRLASNGQLEMYQKFVALLTDRFVVGETTRSERDPEKLPGLPEGYTWEEQSRVDGVGTLIPDLGGGFTSSKDRVTYVLHKTQAGVPDSFEQPRVVSGFAKSEAEFRKSLSCSALLANKGGESK